MNLKLRLQNKATLAALIATCIGFIYEVAAILGVTPMIGEDAVTNVFAMILTVLVGLGVVVDPTTSGIGDSGTALAYTEPNAESELIDMPSGEVLEKDEEASQEPEADIEEEE